MIRILYVIPLVAACGSGTPKASTASPPPVTMQIFPADNAWNKSIAGDDVDPNSASLIAGCGGGTHLHADFGTKYDGAPIGIPYVVVDGSQAKVPVEFGDYADESDPGPYPIPPNAPIEGEPRDDGMVADGDRHVIVVDKTNNLLYEMGNAFPQSGGASWKASGGAKWNLGSNAGRTPGWTSADAAGLPIFPGLARYDEVVENKSVAHALRFTCSQTRKGYVAPASHYASSKTDANLPPMGMRVRIKSSFDASALSPEAQVLVKALKEYGMIVADNGSAWYVSGVPDSRWNDDALQDLGKVPSSMLEVVKMGPVTTN